MRPETQPRAEPIPSPEARRDSHRCRVCSAQAVFMAKHPEANLYRCAACSHVFSVFDSPSAHAYDDHYYDADHRRWFEYPNRGLFHKIEQAISKDARTVLDVGCARGDFLKFLKAARPNLELTGLDISEQKPTPEYEFVRCDVMKYEPGKKFDAAVSLAVIEHMEEPRQFVRKIVELLRPGGQIFLTTVNEDSILYGIAKLLNSAGIAIAFNRLYSAHHINHFTARSLRALLVQTGVVVDRTVMNDPPLRAVDIPSKSRVTDTIMRAGVGLITIAGTLTGKTYQQLVMGHRAS